MRGSDLVVFPHVLETLFGDFEVVALNGDFLVMISKTPHGWCKRVPYRLPIK